MISGFNVFRYITFRTAWAALTALVISFIFGPWLIERMRRIKLGQYIREEGPKSHQMKAGTPTMGGILINVAIVIPTILWADISNPYIWIVLFVTVAYGAIGFVDDYRKLDQEAERRTDGERKVLDADRRRAGGGPGHRLPAGDPQQLLDRPHLPLLQGLLHLNLGFLYIPFIIIVLVGASNGVNLTDGLDGLAIGSTLIVAVTYTILTYAAGNFRVADYLRIAWVPQAGELAVFCGAMVGRVARLPLVQRASRRDFHGRRRLARARRRDRLPGGDDQAGDPARPRRRPLRLEAMSVVLQVASFKLTGRRIFKMSPLHHHFELSGWRETKVVVRFWIIAIIFALLALSTLKLR